MAMVGLRPLVLWLALSVASSRLGVATSGSSEVRDGSARHPHQGLIEPFKVDGKLEVLLSKQDMAKIESGALWTRVHEVNSIGYGIGIQDIAAPRSVIFKEVSDLSGYVGKVPALRSLNVYSSGKARGLPAGETVEKATYTVRVLPGYNLKYHLQHHAAPSQNTLIFFLDYSRRSDIDDMMGKWYLEEHPTRAGWTRLYYQCYLKPMGYVPSMVRSFVTRSGLTAAIGWVKFESERRAPQSSQLTSGVDLATSWRLAVAVAVLCVTAVAGHWRRRHWKSAAKM